MATLCPSCSHELLYDPKIRKMHCRKCDSVFSAEEVGTDESRREELSVPVFTCPSCHGEIAIHGTDTSKKCLFCGKNDMVFSRDEKVMIPELILPFKFPKEEVLDQIHMAFPKDPLLSDATKDLSPEDIRGIYVPYWIINFDYEEAVSYKYYKGKGDRAYAIGRTGILRADAFTISGCPLLTEETAYELEPYNVEELQYFDEDYLAGFYSVSSDLTYYSMYYQTETRAKMHFEDIVKSQSESLYEYGQIAQAHQLSIADDYKYALMPVWFVSVKVQGEICPILVNGQSGTVVGLMPPNRRALAGRTIVYALVLSLLLSAAIYGLLFLLSDLGISGIGLLIASGIMAVICFLSGLFFLSSTLRLCREAIGKHRFLIQRREEKA